MEHECGKDHKPSVAWNRVFHRLEATLQRRKRRSAVSSLFLHIIHSKKNKHYSTLFIGFKPGKLIQYMKSDGLDSSKDIWSMNESKMQGKSKNTYRSKGKINSTKFECSNIQSPRCWRLVVQYQRIRYKEPVYWCWQKTSNTVRVCLQYHPILYLLVPILQQLFSFISIAYHQKAEIKFI